MRIFFFILILIALNFHAHSQGQIDNSIFEKAPQQFVLQIKQLDHFIQRFNNNDDLGGRFSFGPNQSKLKHDEALASLFNLNLLNNNQFKEEAISFIKDVTSQAVNLSFYDSAYYATVNCKVKYKDQVRELKLTLGLEGDANNGSRWVILGANADFLNLPKSETKNIIPPSNHEVDFTELINLFNEQSTFITNYSAKDYEPSQLDILFFLTKNREIKLLNTSLPTYHFLQVNGWLFSVNFFNRNSNNSGWLISSLNKVSQADKSAYRKKTLFIR